MNPQGRQHTPGGWGEAWNRPPPHPHCLEGTSPDDALVSDP